MNWSTLLPLFSNRGQIVRLSLLVLLLTAVVLIHGRVQATSFSTIAIDGTNDFAADETITTTTTGYTAYATWDASNLYLGYTGSDVGSTEASTKWMVWYIDTDPQACDPTSGNGTNQAANFNTQNWSLPFNADYFLQVRSDEGLNQLNSWGGASWGATSYTGAINDNDGANFIELSLPLSDIGNPANVRILGFFLNEQAFAEFSYGAFPAGTFGNEGDAYKPAGVLYDWYEYDLNATGVAPNSAANTPSAFNCVLDDSTTNWGFAQETGTTGSGQYVSGPATPPMGSGSANLTIDAAGDGWVFGSAEFAGVRLADISALSYSTYRTSGGVAEAVALNVAYDPDVTDGTSGWFGRLVYEPYLQGSSPQTGVWENWDTLDGGNGLWWASPNGTSTVDDTCPQSSPCTLTTLLTTFPNIGINPSAPQVIFKAGSGWASFDGNVDNFSLTVNGVSYSYDMEPLLPVHNITQGTDHPTIQDGVDNATAGDIIEIDPGTYEENVTVDKSLTLRGAGAGTNPASHTIIEGTTIGGRGIAINSSVTDVTIEALRIQNFTDEGIRGLGSNDNFTAQNLEIANSGSGGAEAGLYLNGPVDTVLIDNVTATGNNTRGIVIWNGFKTNITITNNDVQTSGCCGIELQDGTASGVTMTGNSVVSNGDSGMSAIGLTSGAGANVISNNTVTNNGRFGIEIKNPNGTGLDNGDGSIVVEGNTVTFTATVGMNIRDHAGIAVFRRSFQAGNPNGYVDVPTGVVVRNNTVDGYQQQNPGATTSEGFGIVVEGTNHTVTGNTINNSDIGIQEQGGNHPNANYVPNDAGDGDQSDGQSADYFGRGNAPVACTNTISGNTFNGNTTDFRQNVANGAGIVTNIDTGEVFCTIQGAIDDVDTLANHTIQISAGTYPESIWVNKDGLQLIGPNANIDPNTGTRVSEAVLQPTAETPITSTTYVMYVTGGNVTINGLTIDGNNPAVTTGLDMNGVDVDALYGVYGANTDTEGPLTVSHNIIRNIAFYPFVGFTGNNSVSSENIVTNNLVDNNVGGRAIMPLWNYYADVTDNVISRTAVGIYSENTNLAATSPPVWRNNTISATRAGIWYNLAYNAATPQTIENNSITVADNPSGTRWDGVWLTSLGGSVDPIIQNNIITGTAVTQQTNGYNMWNNTTTAPNGITISGGSVSDVGYGVWINNWDGYPTSGGSDAGSSNATINQVMISNVITASIYAKDNPLEPDGDSVEIAVLDSTLSNTAVGVLVEGPQATATLKGSTLNNATTAFDITDGTLTAYANNITNFTSGLSNTGGTVNARHNWWGTYGSAPAGVDADSWNYRLGAAVSDWGEGTLGDASLTSAGGSGTGVVVSHGRGLVNVPFGKGLSPAADESCSDYYDFFVVNASGNWTVSVPTDATTDCDDTRTNGSLYQFALSGDQPDATCVGSACWATPAGVSLNGNNLEVTVDATSILQGTPFVAGNQTPLGVPLTITTTLQGRSNYTATYTVTAYTTTPITPTFTVTATADASGAFTVNGFISGTYTVTLQTLGYLQAVESVIITGSSDTIDFGLLLAGDANMDNSVNILDLSILAGAYNTTDGVDVGYDVRADFNADGQVNILDLSLLAGNYNTVGEEP